MRALKNLPFNTGLFFILASITTLLCGIIFASSHQIYRQLADDPQVQISEDMANYLSSGQDIKIVMPKSEVDIAKSIVWFVMVFDGNGNVVASNAKLNGQTPVVPQGVLDFARENGQNRVTWEPEEGVRIASVITSYDGGSVLVGRSLRETENRIDMLGKKLALGWLITIAIAFAGTHLLIPKKLH